MSTLWKAAAIAATAVAISACSNLPAYAPDTPTGPRDATFNLARLSAPDTSRTPDKLEGGSEPVVMGAKS